MVTERLFTKWEPTIPHSLWGQSSEFPCLGNCWQAMAAVGGSVISSVEVVIAGASVRDPHPHS